MLATPPRKQAHVRRHNKQMGEQEQKSPVGHLVIVDGLLLLLLLLYATRDFVPPIVAHQAFSKDVQAPQSLVDAALAVKSAMGTAHVLQAILHVCGIIATSKKQWSMDVDDRFTPPSPS